MRPDLLLPSALTAVALVELGVQGVRSPLVWLCAVITCGCLVLRVRAPLSAALGVFVFFSAPLAFLGQPMPSLGDPPNSVALSMALVIAVYSLGAHAPWGHALTGLVAAELLMAAHARFTKPVHPATLNDYLAAGVVPTLLPFLLGAVVARRRRLRESERRATALRIAAAEERERIARDVHDLVAHSVSVMVVQAEAGEALLATAPDRAAQSLRDVQRAGREALSEMRRTVAALRTGEPATPGGVRDLEVLAESFSDLGLPVELHRSLATELPPVLDALVYRLAREALTNSLRHSDRSGTVVRVSRTEEDVLLRVEDLGRPGPASGDPGFGLQGLREAVGKVGGVLEVTCGPHGGHALVARIPVAG